MRKLILVVIALVLAALVWMFARDGSAPNVRFVAPSASKIEPTAGSALDSAPGRPSNDTAVDRAALMPLATTGSKHAGSSASGLRVIVHFAQRDDYEPQELEVRVLDVLGEEQRAQSMSGSTFLYSDLAPSTYSIEAREASSIPAMQRVKLGDTEQERVVDILLSPSRSVAVHWKTNDGRPIVQAVLDPGLEPGERVMEVLVSHVPLGPERSDDYPLVISSIRVPAGEGARYDQLEGLVPMGGESSGSSEGFLERSVDHDDPTLFCTLDMRTRGPVWLSAWYRGALMDSQQIAPDQTDLVFTTSLAQMHSLLVPVSLRLVDDKTGEPVIAAEVDANERPRQRFKVDQQGRLAFTVEPGWKTIDIVPDLGPPPGGLKNWIYVERNSEAYAHWIEHASSRMIPVQLKVLAHRGEPLDLGEIRLSHGRALKFRVLDPLGQCAKFEDISLIRKSSYDRLTGGYEPHSSTTNDQGLVTFGASANETYVVVRSSGNFDSEPLIVDAAHVSDDPDTIAAEIHLRSLRRVSIVFDPPPRPGAVVVIETPTGLPVQSQGFDELGLCTLGLGGVDYQLRLVVDGKAELVKRFSVTSDPFVLTIQR